MIDKAIGSKFFVWSGNDIQEKEKENSVVFRVYVFFPHFYLVKPFLSTHPPTPIVFLSK